MVKYVTLQNENLKIDHRSWKTSYTISSCHLPPYFLYSQLFSDVNILYSIRPSMVIFVHYLYGFSCLFVHTLIYTRICVCVGKFFYYKKLCFISLVSSTKTSIITYVSKIFLPSSQSVDNLKNFKRDCSKEIQGFRKLRVSLKDCTYRCRWL